MKAPITRRHLFVVAVGTVSSVVASCSTPTNAPSPAATPTSDSSTPKSGSFPLSVDTQLGKVTIPSRPERVVVLMDDEFVVALGTVPVGMAKNPNSVNGLSETVTKALGANPVPKLLDVGSGYPYEQIALLNPDLIVGGVTSQDYSKLAAIAPTLPYETTSTTETWQRRQLTIGRALGKTAEAERLVADTEGRIASVVAGAQGKLKGKTFSFAFSFGQGQVSAMKDPHEAAAALLGTLGLSLAEGSKSLQNPDASGRVTLNLESLDKLAADVVLVTGFDPSLVDQVTKNAGFQKAAQAAGSVVVVVPLDVAFPLVRPSSLTADSALAGFVKAYESAK